MYDVIESLSGKLIVSCQALADEPLYGAIYMAAMARSAEKGGAAGIRANGAADIAAIHAAVALPILGINKRRGTGFDIYITPDYADAKLVVEAGAQIVALDGSAGARPSGEALADIIRRVHDELNVPVMADCSCVEDGLYADDAGADIIATTLAGYTKHGRPTMPGPDLDLIADLVIQVKKPVIAEGRFHDPSEVTAAFERGVYAVVIGTAITRPSEITKRFVAALPD